MASIITFFGFLGGLTLLFLIKSYELNNGKKFLPEKRGKLDRILEDKTQDFLGLRRYLNLETLKLLIVFLLFELKRLIMFFFNKLEETKVGSMLNGKDIPSGSGGGTSSAFLKGMAEIKNKEKESSSN